MSLENGKDYVLQRDLELKAGSNLLELTQKAEMLDFMIEHGGRVIPNPDGTFYLSFELEGKHRHPSPSLPTAYEAINAARRMK